MSLSTRFALGALVALTACSSPTGPDQSLGREVSADGRDTRPCDRDTNGDRDDQPGIVFEKACR